MPERGAAERAGFGPRKRIGIRACFRTQHRRRGDRSRRSWRSGFHSASGHDQYVEQHLDAEGRRIETLEVLPASVLLHFLLFSLAFSFMSSCIFEYPRILSNFPLQTPEYYAWRRRKLGDDKYSRNDKVFHNFTVNFVCNCPANTRKSSPGISLRFLDLPQNSWSVRLFGFIVNFNLSRIIVDTYMVYNMLQVGLEQNSGLVTWLNGAC